MKTYFINSWTILALPFQRKCIIWLTFKPAQFLLIVLLFSCQANELPTKESMGWITIKVEDYQSIDELGFRDLSVIPLSSKEEYLFESVGKILFANKLIFIKPWNQKRILVFNAKGEGVRIIDHQGKGPGEFLSISDFEIDTVHQRIVMVDPGNRKLVQYSMEGDFIEDQQFNDYIKLFKIIYCTDSTIAAMSDNDNPVLVIASVEI